MKRTFIYDPDMEAMIEITRTNRATEPKRSDGVQIIRDIEPYRAMAADTDGTLRPMIRGRRQHREFIARNNYTEVGNDMPTRTPQYILDRAHQASVVASIKRALGE